MSSWLSEKEFRQSGAASAGVTINVAFLHEIKIDYGFRDLLNEVYAKLNPPEVEQRATPRVAADLLSDLRDELKTYFALEEFYGYFRESVVNNPSVSQKAVGLRSEHEELFLMLDGLVEATEKIVYNESGNEVTLDRIAVDFENFCKRLADHEQAEMDLMMRLCNEDIGVGD